MSPRVPTLVAGVDVLSLPLSSLEGFILSRVDGLVSVEDIAMMVSVPVDQLLPMLDRLADLGALAMAWKVEGPGAKTTGPDSVPSAPLSAVAYYDNPPVPPRFDSKELSEEVDIDRKLRRRIINAFYLLPGRTFYELLVVPENADKGEIREAYFELSKAFHPDAHFGRQLGTLRTKTETVFQRMTEAYEVLSRTKRRGEYDRYLDAHYPRRKRILKEVPAPISERPDEPAAVSSKPPRPPVQIRPRRSLAERKAEIAERLRHRMDSVFPSGRANVSDSTPVEAERDQEERERAQESALAGLRRALNASPLAAATRTEQLFDRALAAEAAADLASALEMLQLVLQQTPGHADAVEAERRVRHALGEASVASHREQAMEYESQGKWRSAARSWSLVADKEHGDELANRHAALALLKAKGDLHHARRYAEAAARIQPDSVPNIAALARVYLAAGLKLNARRELEKAVKLNPQDETIKALLKEAR